MRKPVFAICGQQRCRSARASAQSDQCLCFRCLDSIISILAMSKISRAGRFEFWRELSLCLSCICLLAMYTLICVTFSLPPGVRGWLRLLLVALPVFFYLPFYLSANPENGFCRDEDHFIGHIFTFLGQRLLTRLP